MKNISLKFLAFVLIVFLSTSIYSTNSAHAAIPGIKMLLCANNPLGNLYDKEGVTPGQIMTNCKERLDGYSWGSRIYTLIYAPGFNDDPYSLETIGKNPTNPIKANSREGSMSLEGSTCNGFIETGRDHGLFYGSIKLSGFRYDHNGDGKTDSYGGNRCESTYGTLDDGSGRVEAKQDGGVTISFEYQEGKFISKTAKYTWREATMDFDQKQYRVGETAKLTIHDLDNSRFPFDNKFPIYVRIYSDTDKSGLDLSAFWNANYKGIAQMNSDYPVQIKLIDNKLSKDTVLPKGTSHGELRVSVGDTIYAEHYDYTLPKPYMIGDSKMITAIADVVKVKNKTLEEITGEKPLLEKDDNDQRKMEFKKYTSDGKYLITIWCDESNVLVGDNTLNVSIIEGLTQKDIYNISYDVSVTQDNKSILKQTQTYNGKSTFVVPFKNPGMTEITLSKIGTSSNTIEFKFNVFEQSNNNLIQTSMNHEHNMIPQAITDKDDDDHEHEKKIKFDKAPGFVSNACIASSYAVDNLPSEALEKLDCKMTAWLDKKGENLKYEIQISGMEIIDSNTDHHTPDGNLDDIDGIHIHHMTNTDFSNPKGPHQLNVLGNPGFDDSDVVKLVQGVIKGIWNDGDENLSYGEPDNSHTLTENLGLLCEGKVFTAVHGEIEDKPGHKAAYVKMLLEPTKSGEKFVKKS